ncbi:MAG: hypothetical protein ACK5M3_08065 [Dysgonomonas sp.]
MKQKIIYTFISILFVGLLILFWICRDTHYYVELAGYLLVIPAVYSISNLFFDSVKENRLKNIVLVFLGVLVPLLLARDIEITYFFQKMLVTLMGGIITYTLAYFFDNDD